MTTYSTTPAYIVRCNGWEERFKEHPVWAWMVDFSVAFDKGDLKTTPFAANPYLTRDFTYRFNGEETSGGEAAWKADISLYAPFTAHFHEPTFGIIFETEKGYELVGIANLFADLPVPGEQHKTDLSGKTWDIGAPGCFHFRFVKDKQGPGGLRLAEQDTYGDALSLMGPMVKRGMLTAEQAFAGPPKV